MKDNLNFYYLSPPIHFLSGFPILVDEILSVILPRHISSAYFSSRDIQIVSFNFPLDFILDDDDTSVT